MRGADVTQEGLFIVKKTSDYVPADHPLIAIREIVNPALREMDRLFESMYEERGRYSVPPEWLLRGLVLQALVWNPERTAVVRAIGLQHAVSLVRGAGDGRRGVGSQHLHAESRPADRSRCDQDVVWARDATGRRSQVALLRALQRGRHADPGLGLAQELRAEGRAAAGQTGSKSNPEVDFKGQKRSNATHASTTDPDSQLFTKSKKAEALPSFMGHVLMDNRSELAVDTRLTLATGKAEREAALDMLARLPGEQHKTVGADKNYDTEDFVSACRELNVTPHVAQNAYEYDTKTGKRAKRESRIDGRTTRHDGYRVSQVIRKLIETLFGDGKQHGATIRQVKLRGQPKVSDVFTLSMLAVNLRRLPKLFIAQAIMGATG